MVCALARARIWKCKWNDEHLLYQKHRDHLSPHVTWVGMVDANVPVDDEEAVASVLRRFHCVPVFVSEQMAFDFDHGFCQDTLWSVLHNVIGVYGRNPTRWAEPETQSRVCCLAHPRLTCGVAHIDALMLTVVVSTLQRWLAYQAVNRAFAAQITATYSEGALIWVHGYHLLVTPQCLSYRGLDRGRVGLFLHTPFPSSEIFRTLSCRTELLNGMLAANHIGFHLFEYARYGLRRGNRWVEASPGSLSFGLGRGAVAGTS